MTDSLNQIKEQALSLEPEERAKLVEVMLESLSDPLAMIKDAWSQEIEERVLAHDRGELHVYPAEDVFAEARRIDK